MATPKPVRLSRHAQQRMSQRGASTAEVEQVLAPGTSTLAKRGKRCAARRFDFEAISPVNGQHYRHKTVEVVYADEPQELVVVTVKVYYHDT
jgi:phage terminase large subunit-like protein